MNKITTILLLLCFIAELNARSTRFFEHYSTDDGLPQCVVTDIIQDHKGFMWFSTWNGFARFDGQKFRTYKVSNDDTYQINSSRFEHIYEDKHGFIWLESYDDEAHRFDPATETFTGIRSIPEYKNHTFRLSKIQVQPSGKVWLVSNKDGCICVTDPTFNTVEYSIEKERLFSDNVTDVFEDSNLNSWILTSNGLYLVAAGKTDARPFFNESETRETNLPFYSFLELKDEIWFGSSNGQIRIFSKKNKRFSSFKPGLPSEITGLYKVSGNKFIITSAGHGFMLYDLNTGTSETFNSTNTPVLGDNTIRGQYFDRWQQFWFQTSELGIYKFDTRNRTLKHFRNRAEDAAMNVFPSGTKITEDSYGQLWVHPRGGGFSYYNPVTDELEPFFNDDPATTRRFSNILHSLFSDKQGNLWFCTRTHGLEKVSFNNNNFQTKQISSTINSPTANDVRAVMNDNHGRLWVATKEGRIAIYNSNYEYLGDFSSKGLISKNEKFGSMVYSMMMDDEKNIWLGTKTDGLFRAKSTGNPNSYVLENYRKNQENIYSISENVIYSIFQDEKKNIWIGTYGGGLNLIRKNKNGSIDFINHHNNLSNYPYSKGYRIRMITGNGSGKICVGTTTGLIMFEHNFNQPDDIGFRYFARQPGNTESISNNDIHGICVTRKGELFLATYGGGLNKVIKNDAEGFPQTFKSYSTNDGLPSDVCLAVIEDQQENLWISTENNLTRFNPHNERFKTFSDIKKSIATSNFSEASTCKTTNNNLVFGLNGGFLYFSPDKIKDNAYKPYIAFIDFKLNNLSVRTHSKGSVLEKDIDDTRNFSLKHNQNSFSIEYAALDYVFTDNILYAYKLEGFDEDWIYVQKQRMANYTNIPRGKYTFRVKSTNSDGTWIGNERHIDIEVLPSFWETPLAFLIYFVLIVLLFMITLRILFSFYRLKKDVDIEKQLSEMKLRFFTDISHEIRTPLTMISGPVDYLMAEKKIPESARFHLNLISQNTNRMLRLVNQILDLRKTQQVKLKLQETDLGSFTEKIFQGFQDVATRHHISYQFDNQAPGDKVWVDRNSLEIILLNLLSNAFKYTPDHNRIGVLVRKEDSHLAVEVSDTGKGISKEKQKKLFTRFASFNEDKTKPSTGIGLSIVRDLTIKHGGRITLDSEPGKGSTFTLYLLTGLNHFSDDAEMMEEPDKSPEIAENAVEKSENKASQPEKRHTILLVEDDSDLRKFIRATLIEEFQVIEAAQGSEGLRYAIDKNPDLIVSDIMMPEMDGIEMLQKLRENIDTSHIPVILLTAKSTLENKLEGLDYGADDYITKPFSVSYLRARIANLLEQRRRLHSIYQTQLDSTSFLKVKPLSFNLTNKDEMFMKKTIEIIEENMENPDFVIDDLAAGLNMSRSVFYNKIKSLSGLSPIDFIKDVKLQRAAQLILSGEYRIKEIAFMIGISDAKHFRENFKAKFGVSPSEFREENINRKD